MDLRTGNPTSPLTNMSVDTFDDLLTLLGTGKWNFIFILAQAYNTFVDPMQHLSGVFVAPAVQHTCLPPENTNYTGISEDSCSYYISTTSADGTDVNETFPCTEWEYDNSTYSTTLTSDFNLVCGQAHLRATYQSLFSITTLTNIFIGYLSDRYGRKPIIVVAQVVQSICALSIFFANNITVILILRFFQGCFKSSALYVLVLEVCELRRRSVVGIMVALPWAFGIMFWGGAAYLIRDWRYLHLTAVLPLFIRLIFQYFIDESPRWLIVNGNHEKALRVMKKASRLNKVELPSDDRLREIFLKIQHEHERLAKESEEAKIQESKNGLRDYIPKLIRTPAIRIRVLTVSSALFACALVYVGLSLNGDNYSNDPFLYIVLGGIMEIPAYTVSAPIINRYGRKKSAMLWFFFCGIAIFALAFIPKEMTELTMTLAMLGKLTNAMAFMVLFVYMNELFPTEVRMQGVGVVMSIDCIGGTISPYVTNYLAPMIPWLPSVLFGSASFLAVAMFLPLPETLGKPMIETVDCLESLSRKKDKYSNESKEEQGNLTIPEKECKA